MIPIEELAALIHPAKGKQKLMVMWGFNSDLSYDGSPPGNASGHRHSPRTYVVAGILAKAEEWALIGDRWESVNSTFRVPRFHAAHLNGRTHEYEGWTRQKAKEYSEALLGAMNANQVPLMVFVCGIFADQYEAALSRQAKRKLGTPYRVCFNSCAALIASTMDGAGIPEADKFSVLLDRDDGYEDIQKSFHSMKDNVKFSHRARLGTCTPASMDKVITLQSADLVAYEWFKWLNTRGRGEGRIRPVLPPMIRRHVVIERYWDTKNLQLLRDQIESEPAEDGQLIIIPPV